MFWTGLFTGIAVGFILALAVMLVLAQATIRRW